MFTNRLANETSPYLKQHQHNPVHWYAWGPEAFAAAEREEKPIFLSIGYSTCYWCHVMEKDSFEREDVAAVLNEYFISIKVDREERPDVDKVYMDFVVAISGHGGWPMSVMLTPERKPFWGGTFFYRDQFVKILQALAAGWQTERSKILDSADEIVDELFVNAPKENGLIDSSVLIAAAEISEKSFDATSGGFGGAPKFPPSAQLSLLLRIARRLGDSPRAASLRSIVEQTLDAMARGGIYDQVGGGFHRYATDSAWAIPHFEKMLYDNAQLAHVYLEAFQVFGHPAYAEIARETLQYCIRDLRDEGGGFYAAEDAGEVDREGEFYAWTYDELESIMGHELLEKARCIFVISPAGNFERQSNVLALRSDAPLRGSLFTEVTQSLRAARGARTRPHRDQKIIASWNGLLLRALSFGARVLGDKDLLAAGTSCAEFILTHMQSDVGLMRSYCDGTGAAAACLEDYAAIVEGLQELFCASGDVRWYEAAVRVQNFQDELLWDSGAENYRDSTAEELISSKREFFDSAIPSGNAISACNSSRFHLLTGEQRWREKAASVLSSFANFIKRNPHGASRALAAVDMLTDGGSEIVIATGGADAVVATTAWRAEVAEHFLPNTIVLTAPRETSDAWPEVARNRTSNTGETSVYVCEGHTCKAPFTDVAKLADALPLPVLLSQP